MRDREIHLLQESLAKILPVKKEASELFYNKLFNSDPNIKNICRTKAEEREKKFVQVLNLLIGVMDKIHEIDPIVHDITLTYIERGITDKDYDTFGKALISTLQTVLGKDFTPEAKSAWMTAYSLLSKAMKDVTKQTNHHLKVYF